MIIDNYRERIRGTGGDYLICWRKSQDGGKLCSFFLFTCSACYCYSWPLCHRCTNWLLMEPVKLLDDLLRTPLWDPNFNTEPFVWWLILQISTLFNFQLQKRAAVGDQKGKIPFIFSVEKQIFSANAHTLQNLIWAQNGIVHPEMKIIFLPSHCSKFIRFLQQNTKEDILTMSLFVYTVIINGIQICSSVLDRRKKII